MNNKEKKEGEGKRKETRRKFMKNASKATIAAIGATGAAKLAAGKENSQAQIKTQFRKPIRRLHIAQTKRMTKITKKLDSPSTRQVTDAIMPIITDMIKESGTNLSTSQIAQLKERFSKEGFLSVTNNIADIAQAASYTVHVGGSLTYDS
jgi:hypothetical protein